MNVRLTVRTPAVNAPDGGRMSVASVDTSCTLPPYAVAKLPNTSSAVIVSVTAWPATVVGGSGASW